MISSSIKWWPRGLAVAFAAWTALAAFVVAQRYLFAISVGARFDLFLAAVENFPSCWLWAAITPLIVELSRRFPLQTGVWRKNLVFHLVFSLAFLLADVLFDALLASRIPSMRRLTFQARLWSRSFINLFAYGAVVAVAYALQYSRQLSERKARTAELEQIVLAGSTFNASTGSAVTARYIGGSGTIAKVPNEMAPGSREGTA